MKLMLPFFLLLFLSSCAVKQQVVTPEVTVDREVAIPQISPRQALSAIESDTLLLDVREPAELAELRYRVDNQLHIPLSELAQRTDEIPRDRPIIVACHSGGRSTRVIEQLRAEGFDLLINLEGGMRAWVEEGLPVISPDHE